MKNFFLLSVTLGILALGSAALAQSCTSYSRNGDQVTYELQGQFNNTSASFGTDEGNRNFDNRSVVCNGQEATVTGLQISPGNPGVAYVTLSPEGRDGRRGGELSNCRIDVSQNWQTTHYYCN